MRFRRCVGQHETPVTIAAIDMAAIINLKPDTRMPKRRAAGNVARSVAGNPAGFDCHGFGIVDHAPGISNRCKAAQPDQK